MSNASMTEAVLARLTSILPGDVSVYDGSVPGQPTARYVCVYGDTGRRTPDALDGASRVQTFDLQVTSVAGNGPQCRWISEKVRDALTDWIPPVDNLGTTMIRHEVSRRPVADESIADRHLMYAVDQFAVWANRLS